MRLNPFVGPRPFRAGEALYGRDRELRRLLDLLIAERLVLLHAPSGAGKSSLVHAALMPRLQVEGFAVLPPIRVGLEPLAPARSRNGHRPDDGRLLRGLLGLEPTPQPPNRYALSALLSLEEGLPAAEQLPLSQLGMLSLGDYLARREASLGAHDGVLLVFDQFEEILTADPTDVAAKEQFFAQLGAALTARHRWALFAMRDDYVGAIEPYLRPIPTQLGSRFHLDLLEVKAALQAMQQPVRATGAVFGDAAARALCDDLRRVRLLHADGSVGEQLGPHVEPVQLQVVCYRLWEQLPDNNFAINPEDVAALGDVDQALTGYYAERVRGIAEFSGVAERAIRDWCEADLISEQGLRGQVLESAAALDRRAIAGLIDAHLVRGEKRRGATWFELAHDRLVAPVQADNRTWREAHLSPLQRQAALWEDEGRTEGLLLRGEALAHAEAWAASHAGELSGAESAFLLACREARATAAREARATRRIRRLGLASAVAGVLALLAAIGALLLWRNAAQQSTIADMRRLAAQAAGLRASAPRDTLLLSMEAITVGSDAGLPADPAPEESLRQALMTMGGAPLTGHTGSVRALALSPDGAHVASAGFDGTVRIWALAEFGQPPEILHGHTDILSALSFSPDGAYLASGGDDGTIRVWTAAAWQAPPLTLSGHSPGVTTLAFSPDGRYLASGGKDGTARVWQTSNWEAAPLLLSDPAGSLGSSLAFSPDSTAIAVGGSNGVRVWQLGDWDAPATSLDSGSGGAVLELAFSPDGRELAASDHSGTLTVWRTGPWEQLAQDRSQSGRAIWQLAYSPDSMVLAAATGDGTVWLWLESGRAGQPTILSGHTGRVQTIAFSPDGAYLASGGDEGTIRIWAVGTWASPRSVLTGHSEALLALAFSHDSGTLFSGSYDRTLRVWAMDGPGVAPVVLPRGGAQVSALGFDHSGAFLAAGYDDGAVQIWATDAWKGPVVILNGQAAYVSALAFSPDGQFLAHGGLDEAIQVWAVGSWDSPSALLPGHGDWVNALAFSPDGAYLATAGNDDTVQIWSVGEWSAPAARLATGQEFVATLAFSPDGRFLAGGGAGGELWLWGVGDWEMAPQVLASGPGAVYPLAFSRTGRYLASGGSDRTVRVWELGAAQATPQELRGHGKEITALAFSPDERSLASASADTTVRLWALGGRGGAVTRHGHGSYVRALAFSPDGATLASASDDRSVLLWQAELPIARPVALGGYADGVAQVAFSPNGDQLATGSLDGSVRVWPARFADLLQLACQVAGSNLSWESWERYVGSSRTYRPICPSLAPMPSPAESAAALARTGDVDGALALIAQSRALGMEEQSSALGWADLCWWGSLADREADVLFACDRAVSLLPDNPDARESRGLARALSGDLRGASEDFAVVARRLAGTPRGEERLRWAQALEEGLSPFDTAALEALRQLDQ
jgi:WD40 repeat protein